MTPPRLSPLATDILRETMNIGGAHAINALARIVALPIDITVPHIVLTQIENVTDLIGTSEEVLTAILHHVAGDITGTIVLCFAEKDACTLAAHVHKEGVQQRGRDCLNALSEIGNIISGSCFSSLNRFLGLHCEHSVPGAATDMTGALMNSMLAEMGQRTNDALVAQLAFTIRTLPVSGKVFLVLDPDSTQRILQAAATKFPRS